MRHLPRVSAVLVIAALAACNSQKEPATAAVKTAREALKSVDAADMRYSAVEAKGVRDSVENAEAALERAAYPLAIQEASGVPERVTKLKASIAARKAELTEAWTKASTALPPFMTAVNKKLKSGAGLSRADADTARTEMENVSNTWMAAEVAAESGDVGTAAAKSADVKTALMAMAAKLKMKVPPDLQ